MTRRLFTVGPVEVFEDTLKAMDRPMIVHRGKDYSNLQKGIVEKIHKALDTDMQIFLAPASATGFLESCVRCGVNRKMCGITNGSFGDRWQGIGTANGKLVDKIDVEWGKGVKPEHIKGKLMKDIEAVTFISNESSTGVYNQPTAVCDAIRAESDALIFVDGVTSVGAVDLKIKQMAPDALVFGSQKALALPPGLAIIACSERLLKKAETVENRGYYFDLLEYKKFADKDLPLTTPPVSLMFGLDYQLDKWLKEGSSHRYQRHQDLADISRHWAMKRFGLYAEQGYWSNTISPGYGKVKESSFRIGHMGDLTVKDMNDLVHAMDEVMEGMQ